MDWTGYWNMVRSKQLVDLSIKELAFIHLDTNGFHESKDMMFTSVLEVVIGEIRHAKSMVYSRNFLPLAAAFTILDQLGFCYSRSDMPSYSEPKASNLKKSLYYFCGFGENDQDTKTLYALRNSFLHTSSLLSKGRGKNDPNIWAIFNKNDSMISYPDEVWDGNFRSLNSEMRTGINPELVIDMIENAVGKALDLLYEDKLIVACDGGEAEFYYRFLYGRPKTW